MTTTAAPKRMISRACSMNGSGPSLRLMEFTTPLPCMQRRPACRIVHFEESTMIGTRAMSGSAAIRLRYLVIACSPSSMASSMLTSITWAPFRTCWRATSRASAKLPSRISPANLGEPATLVRSPTLTKPVTVSKVKGSRPDRRS